MTLRYIASAFLILLTSACATMSEDECRTADWHAIGFEDGTRGLTPDQIGERRQTCAEHGVTPDLEAWLSGRERGLVEFCTAHNGFQQGRSHVAYNGVCSGSAEIAFLTAYDSGRLVGDLERTIQAVQQERYQAGADLNELDEWYDSIGNVDDALVSDMYTEQERRELLRDLRAYERERTELEYKMRELDAELARLRSELRRLRASMTY